LEAEIALHIFFNVAQNPHFANQSRQTSAGFSTEGSPKTAEHKSKISRALKGRKHSVDSISKMSAAKMGNKHCIGKKNGLGNKSRTGQQDSDEEKIKKAFASNKKHKIELLSPEGIAHCPLNMRLFCDERNLDASALRNVALGKRRSYKGWTASICQSSSSSSSSPLIDAN
jgi:hypothetical protein